MSQEEIIRRTELFVQETLKDAEAGHDWSHIQRVVRNARLILKGEKGDAQVIELACLLHDIADSKFHNGDEEIGPRKTEEFLEELPLDRKTAQHIINIVRNVSFKNELGNKSDLQFESIELDIVKDADRLDAMGAIGIARAFHYGGFKNRQIYDPSISPDPGQSKQEYKKSKAPTINHFYEKLLLLKDLMRTGTGKKLAESRHQFMQDYLERFFAEWEGKL